MRGAHAVQAVADKAVHNMNLPRNAVKGGWRSIPARRLFALLLAEVWELGASLWRLSRLRAELRRHDLAGPGVWFDQIAFLAWRDTILARIEKARQHAKHETGDVVAFVAMLDDRI